MTPGHTETQNEWLMHQTGALRASLDIHGLGKEDVQTSPPDQL